MPLRAPRILFLAVPPALFLSACLSGDDTAPRKAILPLAVGNTWDYVDSTYFGADSVALDSARTIITGMRTVTVGGEERTAYVSNAPNRVTGQPGALSVWIRNGADGNYTVGVAQGAATFVFETLHVKYPAVRGERYPTQFLSFRADIENGGGALTPVADTVEIEVVNTDTVCTVPAGTFACLHYRGRADGVVFADGYYAPGVGSLGSTTVSSVLVDGVEQVVIFKRRLTAYTVH